MGLDDTVQDLADRLGRPLVVLELDLKVAAYSVHDTDKDRVRLAQLLAGSVTPVTESVVNDYRLQSTLRPVRITAGPCDGVLIVLALRHEKRLFGYLYYYVDAVDDESLESDKLRLLESAGPEIGTLLALRASDRRHSLGYSKNLLSALLGDSLPERRKAADTLLKEGFIEDVQFYSVILYQSPAPTQKSVTQLAVEATLEFTARSTTVKILGAVLGSEGVVLFPRAVNRTRLDKALSRPGVNRVITGVGSTKDSLIEVVDSYREAHIACRASHLDPARYGRRVFWDDLGIDRLLLQLPLDQITPSQLPAGVQRLLVSRPHGRELTATLENYLATGGEIKRTASRLNIHRSTLYHRLDRLRQITGCDIADGVTRMELYAGLRIAQLAGFWPTASSERSGSSSDN